MKRLSALLSICLLLAVATSALAKDFGKKDLYGTWEFDLLRAMKEQMESMGQPVPEGAEAMMAAAYMHITFVKDGTFTFQNKSPMGEQEESGKWEVVSTEENVVTVKAVNDSDETEMIVVVTFDGDDNFSALMGEGEMTGTLHASRVKDTDKKKMKSESE